MTCRRVNGSVTAHCAHMRIITAAAVSVLAAAAFYFIIPSVPCLYISERLNPSSYICMKCRRTDGFIISYTHSVNKGRVRDFYSIDEDYSISVEKTQFVSYGAGIPEPEDSQIFSNKGEYLEISNIKRRIPELLAAVGVIAHHAVEINDKTYYLETYFLPQTSLKIEYKRVSPAQYRTKQVTLGGSI